MLTRWPAHRGPVRLGARTSAAHRSGLAWRLGVPLLGLVIVLMQTLALVHAVLHAPLHAAFNAASVHAAASHALRPDAPANAAPVLHSGAASRAATTAPLFAGHKAGSAACAYFDHLLQPHALPALPVLALPAFTPPGPLQLHRAWHLALQALGFLARGPPAA